MVYYFLFDTLKKHFKPCFLILKAFCSTLNSRIGEFDFWCHEQGTHFEVGWVTWLISRVKNSKHIVTTWHRFQWTRTSWYHEEWPWQSHRARGLWHSRPHTWRPFIHYVSSFLGFLGSPTPNENKPKFPFFHLGGIQQLPTMWTKFYPVLIILNSSPSRGQTWTFYICSYFVTQQPFDFQPPPLLLST